MNIVSQVFRFSVIITFAVALFASVPVQAQDAPTETYLVQFTPTSTEAERAAWLAANGAVLVDWMPQIGVAKIERPAGFLSASSDMSAVTFIENDVVVTGQHVVNDPGFNDSQKGYGQTITNVKPAWNVTSGSTSVIVAVLDTGINAAHPEFAGRLVEGYDFVNGDADPADDNGHGTHVAGIVAAGLEGTGTVGMCPDCRIMAVKVLNQNSGGKWSTVSQGILFAVDHGARVINLSLGAEVSSQTLQSAIEYAYRKNVVVVAAAGNNNRGNAFYPAAIPSVIAVAATNSSDSRWESSNFGEYIDVAAPGHMIYNAFKDDYATLSGTSMAAPFVSGLAGLVVSRQPHLTPDEVASLIAGNAQDLGDAGKDIYFGAGRIDAYRTLVAANENVEPAADEPAPASEPAPADEPAPVDGNSSSLYLVLVTK